ncbi:hypothetical protein [Metabacillus endolithicus]|uniref:Uncharacterized protein n=1 Tax=Metabacillus endolithicus TaxID=1535204 RepID=A0ABW5BWA1_9BACI|nr:hypothetical protein [Metabacillus endolithicus]UPG64731.1 hypothetical protein MVE64_06650 [Metabacillus endolithicus]
MRQQRKSYLIVLMVSVKDKGLAYAAGARVYECRAEGKELVKVASLYVPEETRSMATMRAIKILLDEIDEGSEVTFLGRNLERERTLRKAHISSVVTDKGLSVYMRYNPLKVDRSELYELTQDAYNRGYSVIATI